MRLFTWISGVLAAIAMMQPEPNWKTYVCTALSIIFVVADLVITDMDSKRGNS